MGSNLAGNWPIYDRTKYCKMTALKTDCVVVRKIFMSFDKVMLGVILAVKMYAYYENISEHMVGDWISEPLGAVPTKFKVLRVGNLRHLYFSGHVELCIVRRPFEGLSRGKSTSALRGPFGW